MLLRRHRDANRTHHLTWPLTASQAQVTVDLKCSITCVYVCRKKPRGKRKQLLHQLKHPRFTAQELENTFHRNQPPGIIKYIPVA